jgi:hypothetical protein
MLQYIILWNSFLCIFLALNTASFFGNRIRNRFLPIIMRCHLLI